MELPGIEKAMLLRLLTALEQYITDDIKQLAKEGYKNRPGSAVSNLYKMLADCRACQKECI